MYIYMSFKLCVYVFWAHGGEFFDMNTVTKGTLFAVLSMTELVYDLYRKTYDANWNYSWIYDFII